MAYLKSYLDIIGMWASGLCALHCVLLPIVLSLGLLSGWISSAHSDIEVITLIITFIMISMSGYTNFKKYNRLDLLVLFVVGYSVLCGGYLVEGSLSHFIMALGGVTVASTHYTSWTLVKVSAEIG